MRTCGTNGTSHQCAVCAWITFVSGIETNVEPSACPYQVGFLLSSWTYATQRNAWITARTMQRPPHSGRLKKSTGWRWKNRWRHENLTWPSCPCRLPLSCFSKPFVAVCYCDAGLCSFQMWHYFLPNTKWKRKGSTTSRLLLVSGLALVVVVCYYNNETNLVLPPVQSKTVFSTLKF